MLAKEYDENLIVKCTLGNRDVEFHSSLTEPFRIYGVEHDGETFTRIPKDIAQTISKGIGGSYPTTSGGRIRFITDSPYVALKTVFAAVGRNDVTPLSATAATEMEVDGKFGGVFRTPDDFREEEHVGVIDLRGEGKHLVTLFLPTHSHLRNVYVGVKPGSEISHAPDYKYEKPVVFYGSSITHGTGASRAGKSYPAQISKKYGMNFINLGFGGQAKGEPAMAEHIATLEMSAFVYDYDFNSPSPEHLLATHEPFFNIIREKHPDLPIILCTRPSAFRTGTEDTMARYNVVKRTYDNAVAAGDKNIYMINGLEFFGELDCECMVDGTHPNDYGYHLMAEKIGELLVKLV